MSIPLPTLNILYSFAQQHNLTPKDLSCILDPLYGNNPRSLEAFDALTTYQSISEGNQKLIAQLQILTQTPPHELRWIPAVESVQMLCSHVDPQKTHQPSIIVYIGSRASHLLHTEVTLERLSTILLNKECCICYNDVDLATCQKCSRCPALWCNNPCMRKRIAMARQCWETKEMDNIMQHIMCPICTNVSDIDISKLYAAICHWEHVSPDDPEQTKMFLRMRGMSG